MAKSASKEIEGYSKEPHGAGWKKCPQCEGYVKGPLSKTCPACKHVFQFKSKTMRKPEAVASRVETDNKIMLAALKLGGVDKLSSALAKLKDDPVMALAIELGGLEKTQQAVDALGSRIRNG